MADSFSLDMSGFAPLSASLGRASAALVAVEAAVVKKAVDNIKRETQANISTHPTWRRLASTVSYETFGLTGVVGYDDRGQGELAGIAEFGSARHAPHPALMPAAKAEAPRFEKATLNVVADVFKKSL